MTWKKQQQKKVRGILKLGYANDSFFKQLCSRDLSTASCRWFNSTTTEGLVKVVYGCSFQSLWLQQPPIEGALQRRIFLGADTAWRRKEKCGIFKYQLPFPGADPEIFDRSGGSPNFGSERTLPPPPTSHRPRLHVIIFWPLTVYGCTRKGFLISQEFCLVAKCNAHFIKKNQPVKRWYTILSM